MDCGRGRESHWKRQMENRNEERGNQYMSDTFCKNIFYHCSKGSCHSLLVTTSVVLSTQTEMGVKYEMNVINDFKRRCRQGDKMLKVLVRKLQEQFFLSRCQYTDFKMILYEAKGKIHLND
uniref:Uncharacterized protein n=1 Tax=Gasterosteus aculeatus TaxID=69293 RepID=G3NWX8_GASAC